MRNRHHPALKWGRNGGADVVFTTMQLVGFPPLCTAEFMSRPRREQYSKHKHVLTFVAVWARDKQYVPGNWLTWEVLARYKPCQPV